LLAHQPPLEEVIGARAKAMTIEEAELAVALILDPQSYFQRISESATPAPGQISVHGTYGLQIPFVSPRVYAPLIMTRRGSHLNFLSVTASEGKRVGTLPLDEQAVYRLIAFEGVAVGSSG
ncbi:MAG: hypothetical protein M3N46_14620, partial [Actinomycetota bacterium]|nr:hypothetical protein [Actinomycetota bacterium]